MEWKITEEKIIMPEEAIIQPIIEPKPIKSIDSISVILQEHHDNPFSAVEIKPIDSGRSSYRFDAVVRSPDGKEATFGSAIGPESVFTKPPSRLTSPEDVLTVPRGYFEETKYFQCHPLTEAWQYKDKRGLQFLGTADHHELYYYLLKQKSEDINPQDILLNFDSHDDITQKEYDAENTTILAGDFVGAGFSQTVRKTWDHYVVVAPPEMNGKGVEKFPGKAERFNSNDKKQAMERALQAARLKGSKVIVSLDLDFFGATDTIDYDQVKAQTEMQEIFTLINEHRDQIRLVHVTESLGYSQKVDQQITSLYQMMVKEINQMNA